MRLHACSHVQSAAPPMPPVPLLLCDAEVTLLRVIVRSRSSLSCYASLRFLLSYSVLSTSATIHRTASLVDSNALQQSHLSFGRCSVAALFISHANPHSHPRPINKCAVHSRRRYGLRTVPGTTPPHQAVFQRESLSAITPSYEGTFPWASRRHHRSQHVCMLVVYAWLQQIQHLEAWKREYTASDVAVPA